MRMLLAVLWIQSTLSLARVDCYNEDYTFDISAPDAWQSKYKVGGQPCVFYFPPAFTFDSAPVIMYPNLVSAGESLNAFIQSDIETFRKNAPQLKIEEQPQLTTGHGLKFAMRRFLGGKAPNEYETIAYHKSGKSILVMALSARKIEDLKAYEKMLLETLNKIKKRPYSAFFAEMKQRAELETKLSKDFEDTYIKALLPRLNEALQSCVAKDKSRLDSVLQIDKEGYVVSWLNLKNTAAALCVKELIMYFPGPRPPFDPFHISIEVDIK